MNCGSYCGADVEFAWESAWGADAEVFAGETPAPQMAVPCAENPSAGISSISRSRTTRSGWCRRTNSRPFSVRPAASVRTPRRSNAVWSTSRVSSDRSTIKTLRCPFKATPSVASLAGTSLSRPKGEKNSNLRRVTQSGFIGLTCRQGGRQTSILFHSSAAKTASRAASVLELDTGTTIVPVVLVRKPNLSVAVIV